MNLQKGIGPLKASVFSLSRFFRKGKKALPCWLGGRFYPEAESFFYLKSQGLSLRCQKEGLDPSFEPGDWLAVQLLSEKGGLYKAGSCQKLSPPQSALSGRDGNPEPARVAEDSSPAEFSYERKGEIVRDWRSFLRAVEDFFYSEGLAYAETPSLVQCPGTEPHLQPFETGWAVEGRRKKMYLPTSPETHLKKLLCRDWTDFFEIKKCCRNGELGRLHQPEFSILEWYRAFYSLPELMEETYKLLSFLSAKPFFKIPLPPPRVWTVQDLFKRSLGFHLSPQTSKKELLALAGPFQEGISLKDSFEDIFFLIFLNEIEPELPPGAPVFICDYPPQLRGFARLNERGWADRFELYWRGMEMANAFYELIDPEEQKRVYEGHLRQRDDSVSFDEDLLKLMGQEGMPPSSGIALGLDRLFLAIYGKESLSETRLFPAKAP